MVDQGLQGLERLRGGDLMQVVHDQNERCGSPSQGIRQPRESASRGSRTLDMLGLGASRAASTPGATGSMASSASTSEATSRAASSCLALMVTQVNGRGSVSSHCVRKVVFEKPAGAVS